jgi:hypothetical protein
MHSHHITHPPSNLFNLVDTCNSTMSANLDKHAPLKTLTVQPKPFSHWYTFALSKLKLSSNSTCSICSGLVVVQQAHNKSDE